MKKIIVLLVLAVFSLQAENLKFKGKDYYMISNWSPVWRHSADNFANREIFEAGCNSVWLPLMPENPAKVQETVALAKRWQKEYPDVAIVLVVSHYFAFAHDGKNFKLHDEKELPELRRKFRETLALFKDNENIFGISLDEPENSIFQNYGKWLEERGLNAKSYLFTDYVTLAIKWLGEETKKVLPNAYYMPIVAWWNSYEGTASAYDLLVSNSYPETDREQNPGGKFFQVAYDCRISKETVEKTKLKGYIYMPPAFNVITVAPWNNMREYSALDLRYLWLSPVTQDARGICGWIMYRATEKYARANILPLFEELKAFTPWLLGEDCRRLATNDQGEIYIHRMRKVVKMAGEEIDEYEDMAVASRCTWILKRNPADGSLLLLAANNTPAELKTTFTLSPELDGCKIIGFHDRDSTYRSQDRKVALTLAAYEVLAIRLDR